MFIKFKSEDNDNLFIRSESIISFYECDDAEGSTIVELAGEGSHVVDHTVQQVMDMIAKAEAK